MPLETFELESLTVCKSLRFEKVVRFDTVLIFLSTETSQQQVTRTAYTAPDK